ncbi:MAG: hypothetical protein FWH06_03195, partial [Oscillospiraceae bacterium]|nr:hypothetical protein [Oscillospiraceae bacterium]
SASGRPEVVLTYNFNNGDTPVTLELYPFDNHFYTVAVDGELKVFSSRRYMDNLRAALENI